MDLWIWITLVAATAQTLRFMLQKHLATATLSAAGATFARFIYSAPLVVVIALAYGRLTGAEVPQLGLVFWGYAIWGGVSQILATVCVVLLFGRRNFAVGITFKKTEVILSAVVGFVVLGDALSTTAMVAILIGLIGVLRLSDPPKTSGPWLGRIVNASAGLGIASGLLFAFSGVAYRSASLAIASDDSFFRAVVTLACVTAFQMIIMALWLAWRERGEIARVLASWRVSGLVGLTSMVGSACWFWAFTLQPVAMVKALGQVELILSLLASVLFFKEKISLREWQGLALLAVSILLLVLI